MRSTIIIANDLNELCSILSKRTELLVKDAELKKCLRDISACIGIVPIMHGLKTARMLITENLTNAKAYIIALNSNLSIQSMPDISNLLKLVNTIIIEYEQSLIEEEKPIPVEITIEKINKINQRFKDFQLAHSQSVGIFNCVDEDSQSHKNDYPNDEKAPPSAAAIPPTSSLAPTNKSFP